MSCETCKTPSCAIQSINSACTLEQIIESASLKSINYPVCHKNAQLKIGNRIIHSDACDNCELCNYICFDGNSVVDCSMVDERVLFSDLSRMNIFLKASTPDSISVFSEVKAKGNAREKRIDIVIKTDCKLILVKVLSNADKIPYYSRSFDEIISFYSRSTVKFEFRKCVIVPKKLSEDVQTIEFAKTLSELISEVTEE